MIAGVIGVVSILVIREPNGTSMWGSPPAAASEQEAHELVQSCDQNQDMGTLDDAPRGPVPAPAA
jgi:MHS family proline/betaine transporter-like MFS transporter